jgi:uncharacterized protein
VASLKERLQADLTAAMRARDDIVRSTLRIVLAGVTKAEVAGKAQEVLTDDQVLGIIRSEIRKRAEAADIYAAAGRRQQAERERAEAAVLTPYLPPEASNDELAGIVDEEIARAAAAGTSGARAAGHVIKAVRGRLGSQANAARIAQAVKAALAAGES